MRKKFFKVKRFEYEQLFHSSKRMEFRDAHIPERDVIKRVRACLITSNGR
jgi:hypothetical protein